MAPLPDPLAAALRGTDPGPFALIRREGSTQVELLTGTLRTVRRLADLPLPPPNQESTAGAGGTGCGPRALALVPYRQITERGFACIDDGVPLECLVVAGHDRLPLQQLLDVLPQTEVRAQAGGFDISDDEYADIVARVLRDEIGQGEGANFVIHRTYRSTLVGPPLAGALAVLRRLLVAERGAYWTFLVHTGTRTLVGATPERHVTVADGLTMMNPISGTFRHPGGSVDRAALLRFLADPKEIDELYMVLDEELKMMARIADHGGQVIGPYLKEMSHLTHTEYLLAGRGSLDVRDVLRETMFAPTVTGSPLENACRVIARHERRGRRYYAGVLALLGIDEAGRQTLDAPILIRTAEISPTGEVRVPVGATLVRHSTPESEVAETHAKAAGVLAAFGLLPSAAGSAATPKSDPGTGAGPGTTVEALRAPEDPRPRAVEDPQVRAAEDPQVRAMLAARNERLARFWLEPRPTGAGSDAAAQVAGDRVLIVDGEDTFTGMLAHQLRALGLDVHLRPWQAPGDLEPYDLVVAGPGPGDPRRADDPKMAALRGVLVQRLAARRPVLGVCLGHQVLCVLLGLRLHRRTAPYQGLQRDIELFGRRRRVGFYSTFTALAAGDELDTAYGPVQVARDAADGSVHAVRGTAFAGVQFHPESVLSQDGLTVLEDLLADLLRGSVRHG